MKIIGNSSKSLKKLEILVWWNRGVWKKFGRRHRKLAVRLLNILFFLAGGLQKGLQGQGPRKSEKSGDFLKSFDGGPSLPFCGGCPGGRGPAWLKKIKCNAKGQLRF